MSGKSYDHPVINEAAETAFNYEPCTVRIQRLADTNAQLRKENEHLCDGVKDQIDRLRALEIILADVGEFGVAGPIQGIADTLTDLLEGKDA